MKFSNAITIIRYYGSWLLMVLSFGKIMTPTAHEQKRIWLEKNRRRINKMQKELDCQHYNLRGWTKDNDRFIQILDNPFREQRLLNELSMTEDILKKIQ